MAVKPMQEQAPPPAEATAAALLETIRHLLLEMRPQSARDLAVTLDSSLDRDLGFDSLGRVELLERVERAFDARLPEALLLSAETPRDLLRAILRADASGKDGTVRTGIAPVLDTTPAPRDVNLVPIEARTLTEVLEWHVQTHPQRRHITLYGEADTVEEITYAALYEGAMAVAAGLRQRGLQPGQTVALMLPTGRTFFESFCGILLAGGIPVPIYPPARPSQIEDHMRRQVGILANAQAAMLITVPEAQALARLLRSQVETMRHVVTASELAITPPDDARPVLSEHDIAFLQYTSGSTGTPKGVILTHANLLANIRAMMQAAAVTPEDVFVSWLPLYHDMGLIGAWLGSLYQAFHLVLMSPLTFLARPERWISAIHTHRGTISGGPNFAYELCVRRITDPDLAGVDLSSWRIAFNGAEPVSAATMQRFIERFAPYSFRAEAMAPVYGLAEGSLGLAFPPFGRGPRIDRVQREAFTRTGRALPANDEHAEALTFVACGHPLPGHQIRIVDATGYEVPERQEGRLEFCGPSATSGYYRNPDETRQLFHGTWIDSGDLGYMAEGEVFITGRAKDLIIRAGRNIYPHELEEAVGNLPGIRKGCVAAFGSTEPAIGTERLVVLAETRETDAAALAQLRAQVDRLVVDVLGAPPDDVVLAPPQTVLKTSSGKIRRAASRERYERGEIGIRSRAVWRQVVRLAVAGMWPQLRRNWRAVQELAYGAYAWVVFGVFAVAVWLPVAVLPQPHWCRRIVQAGMRLALRLGNLPVHVQGLENLPQHQAYVLVSNHASYLDAITLIAALPTNHSYVAKRELADFFLIRVLLQHLGTEFVERYDTQHGLDDTARVLDAVKRGQAVVFFPEGTCGREPGLRPFRMGAFIVAAQTGVPVVPLALRGTRSILRTGQWLLRRGAIHVTIGTPLSPQSTDWTAAIALRDAARATILRHCGEPALEYPAERGPLTPDSSFSL